MKKQRIAIISGAGMSQESGISTFRDANGLWENHDIMEVASIDGWIKNPELVLEFYNKRRRQLKEVYPNEGHKLLASMEKKYDIHIITQNVDDLHERAGSTKVLHLHGELRKVRSEKNVSLCYEWHDDLQMGDLARDNHQLRPAIVWFGEAVPLIETAAEIIALADVVIIVGTSLQVYPAASLYHYANENSNLIYIDPNPIKIAMRGKHIYYVQEKASKGLKIAFDILEKNSGAHPFS